MSAEEPFDVFSPVVEHAIELASQWHEGTYRKGAWRKKPFAGASGVPTIKHLLAVATVVMRAGWDDETVAASVLHDILEDTNKAGEYMSEKSLRDLVGNRVTDLVISVSEPKLDADGKWLPWKVRKEAYLDSVGAGPVEAVAISVSDKLHNLWCINETLACGMNVFESGPERKGLSAGPDQQLWYFRSVLELAREREEDRLNRTARHLDDQIQRFASLSSDL